MSLIFSSGVRQGMANATGIKTMFAKGAIYLYTGPQPANADAAVGSATLIGIITHNAVTFVPGGNADGLNFDTPALGVLNKPAGETWRTVCSAAGTIGWFRMVGNATDSFGASTTLCRIDGSVATSGADLNLPTIVAAVSTPITIDVFQITLPSGA